MTRVAYFDCASGASGDMLLGALVDLGLSVDDLRADLARVPLEGYRIEARHVHRAGLRAVKLDVIPDEHLHGHGNRGLKEILGLVERATLAAEIKQRAASLFRRLAEAEAAVHGTSPEAVHFHEVGAVDSIVDVIGSVCGLARLGAERYVASPLNVGSGSVSMAHGVFPVPAPATARLLMGVPVYGQGEGELLTPTGALLVTAYAQSYGPLPSLRPEAVGHGAGSRDTPGRPNVLRLVVGQAGEDGPDERVLVLEAELDDMSPQLCEPLWERLSAAGALDVYFTSVQMKKGRPGILITVLAQPEGREAIEEVLFSETTTLGVRRQEWQRSVLERQSVPVDTAYGTIRVKLGGRGGRIYNVQPEFEDCRRAASERGVPVKEVWAAAVSAYRAAPDPR